MMSKDYDGYYYAISGDGSRLPVDQQNIQSDLEYISAPRDEWYKKNFFAINWLILTIA